MVLFVVWLYKMLKFQGEGGTPETENKEIVIADKQPDTTVDPLMIK